MQTPFPKEKSKIHLWGYAVLDLAAEPSSWVEEDRGRGRDIFVTPCVVNNHIQSMLVNIFNHSSVFNSLNFFSVRFLTAAATHCQREI